MRDHFPVLSSQVREYESVRHGMRLGNTQFPLSFLQDRTLLITARLFSGQKSGCITVSICVIMSRHAYFDVVNLQSADGRSILA